METGILKLKTELGCTKECKLPIELDGGESGPDVSSRSPKTWHVLCISIFCSSIY
jgi:hypothetical protein